IAVAGGEAGMANVGGAGGVSGAGASAGLPGGAPTAGESSAGSGGEAGAPEPVSGCHYTGAANVGTFTDMGAPFGTTRVSTVLGISGDGQRVIGFFYVDDSHTHGFS